MESFSNYAVVDGGMATELVRRGHDLIDDDPLWSSRLLQTAPDEVLEVHKSFLEAGSDIIETNTYQASIQGFQEHLGLSELQISELFKTGVELAVKARDSFWDQHQKEARLRPLVAGSVGPYAVTRHDASEYTGNYVDDMTVQDLIDWHRPKIKLLLEGGADLLAIDTIPAQKEAEALVSLLKEFPSAHAWLAFSCKDGENTCHGERLIDAVSGILDSEQIFGIGINCTAPVYIESLLKQIHPIHSQKTIIIYPNSGEEWTKEHRWLKKESCQPLCEYVPSWLELGAQWIGGCCRTTSSDIAAIRSAMETVLPKK